MKFQRTFHVEFRRPIDGESTKMCPLGTTHERKQGKGSEFFLLKQHFKRAI